jgi:hypothetical protein
LSGLATVAKMRNGIIWTAILSSKKLPALTGKSRIIQVRLE